ncbi:glycosyltransferase family 4 protein [Burkholderia ubonensis]|uniref:Glycosyl transferase family 1 n=1 Tax=Burkholderia ubonensis subsp. mesacidophila TaxID=265293 RepID=A0A2A4FFC3_9BURK|nr:glycosyltransferase family 4 protein [Burkholderia ubonensis]PCE32101.1 glycosyl transferase family 1 [Burkholderia ubonensis subsp. mesacidophila]
MKIGISANALKHGGGLERYAMDLVCGVAERGIRPAFFARRFDTSLPEYRLVDPHRINVAFLPGKLRDAWFSWRIGSLRRSAHVDVLIGCNRVDTSEIAICGGTHRGFLQAMGREQAWSDRRQIALESRQYAHADIVVAHSMQMRDELRTLYDVPDEKIEVLFPPVDATRFKPCDDATRRALRQRFGFADHEIVLLFASSSHARKGLPLIEAALRNIDAPLVVAVAGRPAKSDDPRVRYIGYVKDIEHCYRAADFSVLASLYEPFGLVGIESVLCGTPVIFASNIGCCDAIAEHAKFVFAAGDASDLQRALEAAARAPRTAPAEIAQGAVLYDVSVQSHVDALVAMAGRVRAAR